MKVIKRFFYCLAVVLFIFVASLCVFYIILNTLSLLDFFVTNFYIERTNISDLGAYGSYVSGVFAPFAGIAIIVTMVIFSRQSKQQKKLEIAQGYDQHKQEFYNCMTSLEGCCFNKLEVAAKYELYHRLFPRNSMYKFSDHNKINDNDISFLGLKCIVDDFNYAVKSISISNGECSEECILLLHKVSDMLVLKTMRESADGDIYIRGRRSIMNFYTLEFDIRHIHRSVHEVVMFTGNSDILISSPLLPIRLDEKMLNTCIEIYSVNPLVCMATSSEMKTLIRAYLFYRRNPSVSSVMPITLELFLFRNSQLNVVARNKLLSQVKHSYHNIMDKDLREKFRLEVY